MRLDELLASNITIDKIEDTFKNISLKTLEAKKRTLKTKNELDRINDLIIWKKKSIAANEMVDILDELK